MIKMSDRRKKKYDTGTVLSKEQIKILEIEYERNQYISIDRQIQLAEEFNVDLRDIRAWFLDRLANDEYKARKKAKLRPNSNHLSEYASSSSSLCTPAKPLPRLQPLDFSTLSPAAHATDSGLNDFYDDLLQYPHVGGGLPHNLYLKPQHYMTFQGLNGVGSKSMTSQGNNSRSGQAAVADTTPTSSQQNTTIQPQSSNQQRVLRKKEVQHRPHYSDFEKRKSLILWHLNSFTQRMKRFKTNRHDPETSVAANITKHTQGSGQSSQQRQVIDDAAASSSYSETASFTNSAPAEGSPFDCQDKIDFTMKQLNFLEDEFVYCDSLQSLRLWYISCALKVSERNVERWFEIRRKSIKKKKNRKFPTSASNTQSTGQANAEAATSLPSTSSANSEQPAESSQDLEDEPEKSSWKPYAFSAEQNAGLQVAYRENPYLNDERTFALAIYFVIPVRHVDKWFHTRTRTRRGAYLKQKRLEEKQQNKQSTSSSLVALRSSHIHRQEPSQHDGNELGYLDRNFINKNDQSNELAPLDVSDVIHVLGDQQDDANEPI